MLYKRHLGQFRWEPEIEERKDGRGREGEKRKKKKKKEENSGAQQISLFN